MEEDSEIEGEPVIIVVVVIDVDVVKAVIYLSYCILEENLLPEGTFAVHLSPETREAFELVPNWDLSVLEPQKVIQLDKIKEDLKTKGEHSDFFPLSSHITVTAAFPRKLKLLQQDQSGQLGYLELS